MPDRPANGAARARPTAPRDDRGQLSLPAIEVAAGVLLVFGMVTVFALGVPAADTREPQLDAYAQDTATVLADESPRHQDATRLSEVVRSATTFERERAALDRRVDRILPDNLLYRVATPHGAAGYQRPADVAVGVATVTTEHGDVTIYVWYV
jgi:hypothetical protein